MTERADALGWVQVASAPGRGMQLHRSLPVVVARVPA
jgi:hypothetical protein